MRDKFDLIYYNIPILVQDSDIHYIWTTQQTNFGRLKELCSTNSFIAVRTGGKFAHIIKILLDSIFGHDGFVNEIHIQSPIQRIYINNGFIEDTDKIFVYTVEQDKNRKNINSIFSKKAAKPLSWHGFDSKGQGKKMNFSVSDEPHFLAPPVGNHWKWKQETITEARMNYENLPEALRKDDSRFYEFIHQYYSHVKKDRPKFLRISKSNKPYYLVYGERGIINSFWDDIETTSSLQLHEEKMKTSFELIERIALVFSNEKDSILLICDLEISEKEIEEKLKRKVSIQRDIFRITT